MGDLEAESIQVQCQSVQSQDQRGVSNVSEVPGCAQNARRRIGPNLCDQHERILERTTPSQTSARMGCQPDGDPILLLPRPSDMQLSSSFP